MSNDLRFDGRVVIVTGAGRGLGRAYALMLAARGAAVVVNDAGTDLGGNGSDPSIAARVAEEIRLAGGKAAASAASVVTTAGADSIVATAIEQFGRVDVVVNNAGVIVYTDFPNADANDLRRHLDVHVVGSFEVTRAAWPCLSRQRYGRIVLTTSGALFGVPELVSYSTAKGALLSLGRALAARGADLGIRVNLLSPTANTRMTTAGVPGLRVSPTGAGEWSRRPNEAAAMVAALVHESCPVSGEILASGGGRHARIFLAETPGHVEAGLTLEAILACWTDIVSEDGYTVRPGTAGAVGRLWPHR